MKWNLAKLRPWCLLVFLPVLTQCGAAGNLYNKATAKSRAKKQQAAMEAYQKAQKEQLDKSIGVEVKAEVVSVDQELQFVLLRNLRFPGLAPEVTCDVKGGSAAKLKTCPVLKSGFIVADIVSGSPKVGDLVVVSKDQLPGNQNAVSKYVPAGMTPEEFWNSRRSDIPALAPLQAPEGNPAIPHIGETGLSDPKLPSMPSIPAAPEQPELPPLSTEPPPQ